MAGKWALTKRVQYVAVYHSGRGWGDNLVRIKALPNGVETSRCGFSVSKRVGKAVRRNRVRRLLKEIVRQEPVKEGWDIVFMARPSAASSDYHQLRESVDRLLSRADLLRDRHDVVGTRTN